MTARERTARAPKAAKNAKGKGVDSSVIARCAESRRGQCLLCALGCDGKKKPGGVPVHGLLTVGTGRDPLCQRRCSCAPVLMYESTLRSGARRA